METEYIIYKKKILNIDKHIFSRQKKKKKEMPTSFMLHCFY